MATKTKAKAKTAKTAKKAAKPAKAKTAKTAAKNGGENKTAICAKLLARTGGATAKDLLTATGWPTISVPAVARASGLKLRKVKEGRTTTYFGTAA